MTVDHRVLAQKYRPSCLKEVIGQDILVTTLTHAIQHNKLPPAFVFTGVRGTGKTSTARIIALSLNCLAPSNTGGGTLQPCQACSSCVAIQEGRHIDVIEMDAASHTGVDDIREIIEASKYRPLQSAYKIYIIDEAHMLSKSAFNALLKTLEEPPAHVKFILATTEIRKIPSTVLSRCMRFDLQRIPSPVLKEYYKTLMVKEGIAIDDSALQVIADMAEGSARDGLSLLEQAIHLDARPIDGNAVRAMLGRARQQNVEQLFDLLLQGKIPDALTTARQLYNEGIEAESLLQSLLECIHQTSLFKVENTPASDNAFLKDIAPKVSIAVLTGFWQIILKGLDEIKQSPFALMAMEMVFIRLSYVKNLLPAEGAQLDKDPSKQNATLAMEGTVTAAPKIIVAAPVPTALVSTPIMDAGPNEPTPTELKKVVTATIPSNFEALVKLVAEAREPLLYTHLVQDVQMVAYTPGHLTINIVPEVSPYFVKDLKKLPESTTKTDWVIETSQQAGDPSLKEQQEMAVQQKMEACKQEDIVQKALDLFPGSVINNVYVNPALGDNRIS